MRISLPSLISVAWLIVIHVGSDVNVTNAFVIKGQSVGVKDKFGKSVEWRLKSTSPSESSSESDASLVEKTFRDLYEDKIPTWLLSRCEELGYVYPTKIQQYCLDDILGGEKDVIVRAQTGSGKTLCYLLPLLATMDASRAAIQAMILVPTRELGLQVCKVARKLSYGSDIVVMPILQGSFQKRQRAWAWSEPPQLVVGTPQEVHEMVKYGGIRYNAIQKVVVDEFDATLLQNSGQFQQPDSKTSNLKQQKALHELLSKYLSHTYIDSLDQDAQNFGRLNHKNDILYQQNQRQTIFCSATLPQPKHFQQLCIQNQWVASGRDIQFICASPKDTLPPNLQHAYVVCRSEDQKLSGLLRTLKREIPSAKTKRILVFCNEFQRKNQAQQSNILHQKMAYALTHKLTSQKTVHVSILNYQDSLRTRAQAMDTFRGISSQSYDNDYSKQQLAHNDNDDLYIMIATDLAARGLDVVDVSHVIHYDLPTDADTYVHRSGRAGRFGQSGRIVSMITSSQEFVLQRLVNQLQLQNDITCLARQQSQKKKDKEILVEDTPSQPIPESNETL